MSGPGDWREQFDEMKERQDACVNALSGISAPAAFVQRAKARTVWCKRYLDVGDPTDWLKPDEIAALASEWTEDE